MKNKIVINYKKRKKILYAVRRVYVNVGYE